MRLLPGMKGREPERTTAGKPRAGRDRLREAKVLRQPARYGYASGRVKVLETQLLNRHRLGRLIEADYGEALQILQEMDYGAYLAGARSARDVEAALLRYLADLYEWLRRAAPSGSQLTEFIRCRYDFHNLRALWKERCCGEAAEDLTLALGLVPVERMRRGLDDPRLLPSHLAAPATELSELSAVSSQEVDLVVDRHYLQYRLRLALTEGSGFMIDSARAAIDAANFKVLLRGRNLARDPEDIRLGLAEGGEVPRRELAGLAGLPVEEVLRRLAATSHGAGLAGSLELHDGLVGLADYDRRVDERFAAGLRGTRRVAVGVEPLLGYVNARETDVMALRVILAGKLHHLTPAEIEARVMSLYPRREGG